MKKTSKFFIENLFRYGRPPKGSRTEQRGLDAQAHIQQEVKYLCEIIQNMGRQQENSTYEITFKELFDVCSFFLFRLYLNKIKIHIFF